MTRRHRNKKLVTFAAIALTLIVGVSIFYIVQEMMKAMDPGYGEIGEVQISQQEDDLNVDPTENIEGEPLTCLVINCGDALAVLVDIGSTEVLYDTGYAETGKKVAKKIKKYIDGPLDYLVLSHSHADHVGGVPRIAKKYDIETVITSGEKEGSSVQFDDAMKALQKEGCSIVEDDDMEFGLDAGATLRIVETFDPGDTDNPNDLSVVADVIYDDQQILMTGDAEADAERTLIGKFEDIDLLVAGHHMSSTSNTLTLLREWNPDYIFVSCAGKDSEYGFPHRAALERCLSVTTDIYATFKSGSLKYTTDGKDAVINCDDKEALTLADLPK